MPQVGAYTMYTFSIHLQLSTSPPRKKKTGKIVSRQTLGTESMVTRIVEVAYAREELFWLRW